MRRRLMVSVLVLLAGCGTSGGAQDASFATGFVSVREQRMASRNPEYARRLSLAERTARRVKTDSLRKLYLLALDAPRGRVDTLWNAISCQLMGPMSTVGGPVTRRVQLHLQDSLLALPGVEARWRAMNGRLSGYGTLEGCVFPAPTQVPDSLEYLPWPNALP